MDDMANRVIKLLAGNKGKKLTREEIAARVADNMHLAALAISEELANASRDEDGEPLISLGDRMAAFKQLREWEMAQARIGKLDPKDKEKGNSPSGIEAYQAKLKDDQSKAAEAPPAERVTAEGERDKRHDNKGRPPGQSLQKRQAKILAQQKRLREKEDAAKAEAAPPAVDEPTREM